MMKKFILILIISISSLIAEQNNWKNVLQNDIQLHGHRNWILVVDAAYPYQSKSAIKTIATGVTQIEVVKEVLNAVENASHVDAEIFLDKEIDFVPANEYPEIKQYKKQLNKLIDGKNVEKILHEEMIEKIDESAKTFHILVLKSDMVIPYTSVFIRLDCGYWNGEQEKKIRTDMKK